jgi:cell division protein ZapA
MSFLRGAATATVAPADLPAGASARRGRIWVANQSAAFAVGGMVGCARMDRRTVQILIGGQSYKVVSPASESEVQRLASMVDEKLAAFSPTGRASSANALVLAALALAHEIEEERARRKLLERRARDVLRRALVRIDGVLESGDASKQSG